MWREDSENSAAQYVRASNSPSVFSFLLSSHRASFLRIAPPPLPSFRPVVVFLLLLPSAYLSIHLYISPQPLSLQPGDGPLYPSPLISSYTLSPSTNTPPLRQRSRSSTHNQTDRASSETTPGSVIAFNGPRKGDGGTLPYLPPPAALFAFARPSGFVSPLSTLV